MKRVIYDSVVVHFSSSIFLKQWLIHLTYPLFIWTTNATNQQFLPSRQVSIVSFLMGQLSPVLLYSMITAYFLSSSPSNVDAGQHRTGASLSIPLFYYAVHRCMIALKYASLSKREYDYFMHCDDYEAVSRYQSQMQLVSGWLERTEDMLEFEVFAAATRCGQKPGVPFYFLVRHEESVAQETSAEKRLHCLLQLQRWKVLFGVSPWELLEKYNEQPQSRQPETVSPSDDNTHSSAEDKRIEVVTICNASTDFQPQRYYRISAQLMCNKVVKSIEFWQTNFLHSALYVQLFFMLANAGLPIYASMIRMRHDIQLFSGLTAWDIVYMVLAMSINFFFFGVFFRFMVVAVFDVRRQREIFVTVGKVIRMADVNEQRVVDLRSDGGHGGAGGGVGGRRRWSRRRTASGANRNNLSARRPSGNSAVSEKWEEAGERSPSEAGDRGLQKFRRATLDAVQRGMTLDCSPAKEHGSDSSSRRPSKSAESEDANNLAHIPEYNEEFRQEDIPSRRLAFPVSDSVSSSPANQMNSLITNQKQGELLLCSGTSCSVPLSEMTSDRFDFPPNCPFAFSPQLEFQLTANILAWSYIRILLQNFGMRFRVRLDVFVGILTSAGLIMMVITMYKCMTIHDEVFIRDTLYSPYFVQSQLAVLLLSLFLLLLAFEGARTNQEMERHRGGVAVHWSGVLREQSELEAVLKEKRLLLHQLQNLRSRIDLKELSSDVTNSISQASSSNPMGPTDETRKRASELDDQVSVQQAAVNKLEAELENVEARLEAIQQIIKIGEVQDSVQPFLVLGIPASYSLTMSMLSLVVSYYSVLYDWYVSAAAVVT